MMKIMMVIMVMTDDGSGDDGIMTEKKRREKWKEYMTSKLCVFVSVHQMEKEVKKVFIQEEKSFVFYWLQKVLTIWNMGAFHIY